MLFLKSSNKFYEVAQGPTAWTLAFEDWLIWSARKRRTIMCWFKSATVTQIQTVLFVSSSKIVKSTAEIDI